MSRGIIQTIEHMDTASLKKARERGKVLITNSISDLPEAKSRDQDALIAALMVQDQLVAVQTINPKAHSRIGAVYLGKVKKMMPNLNACFVEITNHEQCFLSLAKMKTEPFLTNRAYDGRILEGDELLVQIAHEGIKTKQAEVTAKITVSGTYFVFATGETKVGISHKIDDRERKALKELLREWQITDKENRLIPGEGMPPYGLVVRTCAGSLWEEAMKKEQGKREALLLDMRKEFEQLYRRFSTLFLQGRYRICNTCLYEAGSALEEVLEAFSKDEYEELVTDCEEVYAELTKLAQDSFLSEKQIRYYEDQQLSLSQLYRLPARLKEALGKTVWLKSGANLVIEQTESLTAIDVNTGKSLIALKHKSPEETIRRVNLEAAGEIARQLRLRNLSGIIIVDFINLATLDQEEELLQSLRELVKDDPVTVRVVDMTKLGLVEITRKKVSPSLREQLGC